MKGGMGRSRKERWRSPVGREKEERVGTKMNGRTDTLITGKSRAMDGSLLLGVLQGTREQSPLRMQPAVKAELDVGKTSREQTTPPPHPGGPSHW